MEQEEFITQFWEWKMRNTNNPTVRDRIHTAQRVCEHEVWSVEDLKQLSDPSSSSYKHALAQGMAEGIAKNIRKDLREFKQLYRARILARADEEQVRINAARELAQMSQAGHIN